MSLFQQKMEYMVHHTGSDAVAIIQNKIIVLWSENKNKLCQIWKLLK